MNNVAAASRTLLLMMLAPGTLPADDLADAARGAALVQSLRCAGCHNFAVHSGKGPLARLLRTRLTPARLVAAMWNHAPVMYNAIAAAGTPFPRIEREQSHDILAYFASYDYFEVPSDPRKGAKLFYQKLCNTCHAGEKTTGPPVAQWKSAANRIEWYHAMWSHAPHMKAAMDHKTMNWPSLSATEMGHLLAFVRPASAPPWEFRLGDPARGALLFGMKNCVGCHNIRIAAQGLPIEHTLTDMASVLWNHAPMMMTLPPMLNRQELSDLTAYLWTTQYFDEPGNPLTGKDVFEEKECHRCHTSFTGKQPFDSAGMLYALWRHTPAIVNQANAKGIAWPKFYSQEMADLAAYCTTILAGVTVR
ncbi:MAG: c-type cytochrome [Acidobacteria bacterium]|nr:c-type cytochrome [Acidobacteriota bacterium]